MQRGKMSCEPHWGIFITNLMRGRLNDELIKLIINAASHTHCQPIRWGETKWAVSSVALIPSSSARTQCPAGRTRLHWASCKGSTRHLTQTRHICVRQSLQIINCLFFLESIKSEECISLLELNNYDWYFHVKTKTKARWNITNQSQILKSHKNKNWKKSIWLLGLFLPLLSIKRQWVSHKLVEIGWYNLHNDSLTPDPVLARTNW